MNYFRELPKETLFHLFSYLDKESRLTATEVCEQWRTSIHYMSWKSISDQVKQNDMMRNDFSAFGWLEDEHEFVLAECKCIKLDLGYYPFKNASWTKTSYDCNINHLARSEEFAFEQSKVICVNTDSFQRSFTEEAYEEWDEEWDDEADQGGQLVTNVNLHEIDFTDMYPSWKRIQKIKYEEEYNTYMHEGVDREDASFVLKNCGNTLVMQEIFWDVPEIRITLWNIKPWSHVCELNYQETVNSILKSRTGLLERNVAIFKFPCNSNLHFEVSSDLLVVSVDVSDLNINSMRALALFWQFDALHPAAPRFLTYIEETDIPTGLYLNAKYFCERKRKNLEVFAVDDIKNNATRKSWFVHTFDDEGVVDNMENVGVVEDVEDVGLLEGGTSNRFAAFYWKNSKVSELNVFNVESGDCLFNLKMDSLAHLMMPGLKLFRRWEPAMKFLLGKLIFFQPLVRQGDCTKLRYQIVIVDEKAIENKVVIGGLLIHDGYEVDGPIFMRTKSIVKNCLDYTYHWKLED